MSEKHIPVLLDDVVDVLAPRDGAVYVDATFGAGGYSRALLEAADCTVWGIDRDPDAAAAGNEMAAGYGNRLTVLKGRFGDMRELLAGVGVTEVDGIALDLGVSSMQIDEPCRGFSFRFDGPLDMRMERDGMSAADAVNRLAEKELADIIYRYGEERASRKIARAIVELREQSPITRTGQLAELVRRVVRRSKDGIDPATRTFQALRIYVNEELAELDRGLAAATALLREGGRLAAVSFHSLEDRRLKTFFQERSGAGPQPSRHMPMTGDAAAHIFEVPERRGRVPSDEEVQRNPRARSARLRWGIRTAAPLAEAA
ncbi:MAG: 16S rRNA (cytosine(1402)-N(4))-methyltransferase RsmH [Rhodospirillales bacterium]|nr:16S rRNA (cytosine(1402)-N(4))-methyltransferase RsmH [Rhodospirillales bacterium]MBO6787219.1 16S rRNA (cytosine(1402)-N(4))-methyltransferase RsmH [Rhodospirillales bacterium]